MAKKSLGMGLFLYFVPAPDQLTPLSQHCHPKFFSMPAPVPLIWISAVRGRHILLRTGSRSDRT
jgi:hypothetical protein